ncbi:hypothetical protein OAO87_00220 [bacterium]|nr:hypothetical protein [bacterium]
MLSAPIRMTPRRIHGSPMLPAPAGTLSGLHSGPDGRALQPGMADARWAIFNSKS